MPYQVLADLVLMLHVALVAFVVGGLVLVVAGNLRGWRWVNAFWFRLAHLAAIAVVAAQAWLGATCPLTSLEMWLRAQARLTTYSGSFIEHWLQRLLYYEAPAWVFVLAYSGFGLLVLAAWWYFPPERRQRSCRLTFGRTPMPLQRTQTLLLASTMLITLLVLSGVRPFDRTTWVLEVFPVVIALPLLWATYHRFPLTNLLYTLIFFHALVLILGGAYTYSRVPLGFWLADLLDLSRNPYDRIGHFFQGLVPAIAAREILLRGRFVRPGKMLAFIVICIVLAISACYELFEWAAAMILGQGADEFLGTQGDPWDTQSDMFLALIGGSAALLLLSRSHDRQLKGLLDVGPGALDCVGGRDYSHAGIENHEGKC